MSKIIGNELKNIPWEEKPEGYKMPVWRFSGNHWPPRNQAFQQRI